MAHCKYSREGIVAVVNEAVSRYPRHPERNELISGVM